MLEFVDGLAAKVAAVDEKEDAFGSGVLDEPIDLGDGGESLAGTGGHLDEGAGAIGSEGFLEAGDSIDLAIPERSGVQLGELPEPGAKGVGLLDEFEEMRGRVKGEDRARAGVGVALVTEIRLDASGLVGEGQRISPALGDPFLRGGVALALLGDAGEGRARFFGLENTEGFSINKKDVIGRTALGLHLADSDPASGGEVDLVEILNSPTRRRQLGVDRAASFLFRGF